MKIFVEEPESYDDGPAPVLSPEYLSKRPAQLFMTRMNVNLPEPTLIRINQYLVLFIKTVLDHELLGCPPTLTQIEEALEDLMESNLTYKAILRAAQSALESPTFGLRSPVSPVSPKSKHSSLSSILQFSFLRSSSDSKAHKVNKRKTVPRECFSRDSSPAPTPKMIPNKSMPISRDQLSIVGPWQVMYSCEMAAAYGSPQLLAHIEMAGHVLNTKSAKFLGAFTSQMAIAMLRELARLAQISNLASVTIPTLNEAFHPTHSLQPSKFPFLQKMKYQIESLSSAEDSFLANNQNIGAESHEPKDDFVPAYLSTSAAEVFLSKHPTAPGLTRQGLLLVNKFLDQVAMSLASKLTSLVITLPQLQAALKLSLKSCPLVIRALETVERLFPSFIAVPVRPLVTKETLSQGVQSSSPDPLTLRHHYRLLAHYYSPHSELYQSRTISNFFKEQPLTLDTRVSRYLSAILVQLGQEIIRLGAEALEELQYNPTLATGVISTHIIAPVLAGALPDCSIATSLHLYHFNHIDPAPEQLASLYPYTPPAETPSLRTSNETASTASSFPQVSPNNVECVHELDPPVSFPNTTKKKISHRMSRSVSLDHLKGPYIDRPQPIVSSEALCSRPSLNLSPRLFQNRPSLELGRSTASLLGFSSPPLKHRNLDPYEFDAILQADSTVRLTLTPTLLTRIPERS